MRLFFSFLSLLYIMGIFLYAGSPVVYQISPFNPYSLLHIPLYGILTLLLVLSFIPASHLRKGAACSPKPSQSTKAINPVKRLIVAGLVALGVAMLDEFHQSFIISREGSLGDVLLDLLGIILAVAFIFKIHQRSVA